MMEFGLVEKFIAKEMANTSYCLMPPGREGYTELRPLALGDFLGVLSLYGAGVVGSMGMFVAEGRQREPSAWPEMNGTGSGGAVCHGRESPRHAAPTASQPHPPFPPGRAVPRCCPALLALAGNSCLPSSAAAATQHVARHRLSTAHAPRWERHAAPRPEPSATKRRAEPCLRRCCSAPTVLLTRPATRQAPAPSRVAALTTCATKHSFDKIFPVGQVPVFL
ncbi:hypothetical protein O3P69_018591 [Scylla paramamosain]|uniref:Uncharacterized protein n=1 Tax=Scylla paramamosain TaxID=85552 RepID=A0AAW0T1R3_SCYPA